MKAIVYDKYGPPDVLRLEEVDKPLVTDDGVLVRVRAASVNPYDWHFMRGAPYFMRLMSGLRRPKANRLGADVAGEVEAVGRNVTRFRPGDQVFGEIAGGGTGSFAEYACVAENSLELKPSNMTFEQAAAVPLAGLTALQGLRDWGEIQEGQKVLVIGASGGVGTFAVQIAKSFGAEATGVCSTRNVDMVRSLGAAGVIDYTREDFTRSESRYDMIFQLAGRVSPSDCRRVLTHGGRLVLSSGEGGRWIGPLGRMLEAFVLSAFVSEKMLVRVARVSRDDLRALRALIEAGEVKSVIDRCYALSEAPEAIRYVEQGHARGKVVIAV